MAKPTPIAAEFFEKYPLYRKWRGPIPERLHDFEKTEWYPPIRMRCGKSDNVQTFIQEEPGLDGRRAALSQQATLRQAEESKDEEEKRRLTQEAGRPFSNNSVNWIRFLCAGCKESYYLFVMRVAGDGKSL